MLDKRIEANIKISKIIEEIEAKWDDAKRIADESGVSFKYTSPDGDHSGFYYPKRPDDWVVWNDYDDDLPEGYEEDPNKNHPEYEYYHPWNNCGEYEHNWNHGNWISSSERC
jgi:hypothetical protein